MTKAYLARNIEDVTISGLASGNVLTYDLATEKWKNETPSGFIGIPGSSDFWSSANISDTPQTVIANGTGDVVECITILYAASAHITGEGAETDSMHFGGTVTLEPGDSMNIVADSVGTLVLTCAADGSVTIARGSGSYTYKVSFWMVWL